MIKTQTLHSFTSKLALAFLLLAGMMTPGSLFAQELPGVSSWFQPVHTTFWVSREVREAIRAREYYEKITEPKEKVVQDGVAYEEPTLLSWDERGFAYVGVCESIWYPEMPAADKKFVGDWEGFCADLKNRGMEVPELTLHSAPWHSQEELDADLANLKKSDQEIGNLDQITRKNELNDLLTFLKREDVMKIEYGTLVDRLEKAIDPNSEASMLKNLPPAKAEIIKKNFDLVAAINDKVGNPLGLYALVDYCNFKGEGVAPAEHYNTQAWGLGEVLFQMEDLCSDISTLNDYIVKLKFTEKRADIDANNLSTLELFVIVGAKVLDDRIENNKIERTRIQGTPAYAEFIARYGDEKAILTDAEKIAREKAFLSDFGLPYKDNSQYRETLFYPHLVDYLSWPEMASAEAGSARTSPSSQYGKKDDSSMIQKGEASQSDLGEPDPDAENKFLSAVVLFGLVAFYMFNSEFIITILGFGLILCVFVLPHLLATS
ncbi:MAG: hypothetical protein ACOYK6_05380 [Chthoniobacterales bacterium]